MVGAAAGGLVLLVATWLGAASPEKQTDTAVATAKRLVTAASEWKREHGEIGCPTLSQLIHDRAWAPSERADDPWGGRFLIQCSEHEVRVQSAGSDGKFETADDIAVGAPWNS